MGKVKSVKNCNDLTKVNTKVNRVTNVDYMYIFCVTVIL